MIVLWDYFRQTIPNMPTYVATFTITNSVLPTATCMFFGWSAVYVTLVNEKTFFFFYYLNSRKYWFVIFCLIPKFHSIQDALK